MTIKEYRKNGNPNGNKGAVARNEYGGQVEYIAVTATTSKSFKTEKGARKFMERMGYS